MIDNWNKLDDNRITLLPPFDHKEPEDDDCGLPEHPIFSNYTKYLWTSHTRSGGAETRQASVQERPEGRLDAY